MNLCEHFGFDMMPFGKQLASCDLFPSERFEECWARLSFIVHQRAFGVLTGAVGAGKSTALRRLRDRLDPSQHRFLYVARSSLGPRALYRELLHQLDTDPPWLKQDAQRLFDEQVMELHRGQDVTPVVVIDEVHLWDPEMLEEVRFLTNFSLDAASPLALILSGQPELRDRLGYQQFTAIRQRVEVWHHLEGMSHEETQAYIRHHLETVGVERRIFTDAATALVQQHTQGIPRRINNRCRAALLDAFTRDQQHVEERTMKRVMHEFALDSGSPT